MEIGRKGIPEVNDMCKDVEKGKWRDSFQTSVFIFYEPSVFFLRSLSTLLLWLHVAHPHLDCDLPSHCV
jgi:hypothetical protein